MKKLTATIIILIALTGVAFFVFQKKTPEVPIIAEDIGINNQTIGKSVQGRKIEVYKYGNGSKNILFVGGIHGGYEWNTTLLAYGLIDYLTNNPQIIPQNLTVNIIPSANPDGLFKVVGKEGRFDLADVSTSTEVLASGRFNANGVDLNRNFDCKWQPESTWQSRKVSAGSYPFSEPEAEVIKNFILERGPLAVVFWHSKSNAVYASQCEDGILPETLEIMKEYSDASGYKAIEEFGAYEVTGASDDWLSSIGIPAITVELETHEAIEWEQNLAGTVKILEYYGFSK